MSSCQNINRYLVLVTLLVRFMVSHTESCSQQEFKCSSSKCIPRHLKCNGEDDCDDSSDEINCINKKCDDDEFECLEGICIPSSLVCNGKMDCPRGLDEMKCGTSSTAPPILPTKIQGVFRTADGQSVISFPIFESSPAFRIYVRFTAFKCIGHLVEITSQTTDEFFLISLANDGNIALFFKTSLGPGLITIPQPPGDSFCNGKRYLLTIKRNLAEIVYRVNRGRTFRTKNMFLTASLTRMNKINIGFGLEGCVSGADMLYYDNNTSSHTVGVSKGCVFTEKTTTPTPPPKIQMSLKTIVTTTTRNRIRKSELRYTRVPSLAATTSPTLTQPVTQHVTQGNQETTEINHQITQSTQVAGTAGFEDEKSTKMQAKTTTKTNLNRGTPTKRQSSTVSPIPILSKMTCRPLPAVCEGSGLRQKKFLNGSSKSLAGEHQIRPFLPFIRANCSAFLRTFLCASFFPTCSASQSTTSHSTAAQPCREFCLKTKYDCSSLMNAFEFEWPKSLNCEVLPSKTEENCFMPQVTLTSVKTQIPEINITKGCGGILRHSKGLITSPNYPHPYPSDTTCQWAIVLPPIYRVINLLIEDASLESDKHCGYDYILFKDGLSNQVGEKMCGFLEYPRLVTVKGNIAVIVFRSDSALNKKGILIKYKAHTYP